MKLILVSLLLVSSQVFALDLSLDCNQTVGSEKLKAAAKVGFDRIDRMDTPYSFGLATTDRSEAKFCPSESSKDDVMVGAVVTASSWSEEGDQGLMVSECFLRLERTDGEWNATYLVCEDFGIEEQF